MRIRNSNLLRAGALATSLVLAAPLAASADVYGWRTEDGVYAYTDDPKQIPARYADQAVAVRERGLGGYERLTREDTAASHAVSQRLAQRLEYLRQVNTPAVSAASAGSNAGAGRTTISVATGSPQAPTLDIALDQDAGPIVVEPLLTKRSGKVRTRTTTVVKQGDRTLAVLKGRRHHIDVNSDIYDEDDLIDDD